MTQEMDSGKEALQPKVSRGGRYFAESTSSASTPANKDDVPPSVKEVMVRKDLKSSDQVLCAEGGAHSPSLSRRLEANSAQAMKVLASVMSDPSLITTSMRTGKKAVVEAPSLETADLEALVSLSGKKLPGRQKTVSKTVKVEGEADKEVKSTVDKTEEDYRAELIAVVEPSIFTSVIQERMKEFRKATKELEVGTKLAYAHYRSLISKPTLEIMKAYPDFDKVERDSILVGEGPCLLSYLIMATSKLQSGACKPLATALSIIRFISTYQKPGTPHTKFFEGITAASEAMATAGGGVYCLSYLDDALVKREFKTKSDKLTVKEMHEALQECNVRTQAAIATEQLKKGNPTFYSHKRNLFQEGHVTTLPRTLQELNVQVCRFCDPAQAPSGAQPRTSTPKETKSPDEVYAALATQAGVRKFACFRCGGDHKLSECDITAEEVSKAFRNRRNKGTQKEKDPKGGDNADDEANALVNALLVTEEREAFGNGDLDVFEASPEPLFCSNERQDIMF
ncbi:hypothetical protein THAOC_16860 [Thalassiosira oceanica]|uniref:Uncharacterized protein n=1 Tax=Thalassiosira oceanica TaxID=159749 RepID=K0SB42_THAOC|nr:hypothetical protein THAOC_16860 [Thalassiosira oceanica]|eukprot:EJK62525.1 hypothetical protein THAOC_16860 [Thalassiosira oceanica]